MINVDRSNAISRGELLEFMNKHYLGARIDDAEDIIKEYDGTLNGCLDFDEFC